MQNNQMNEIEEYLFMIFLESIEHLSLCERLINGDSINMFEADLLNHAADNWNKFKQEELGRTLPETYEFLATDTQLERIRKGEPFAIGLSIYKEFAKNKIKITVVEE